MSFSLTILGSSSAVPTSRRYPAAHVLNVHERYFLIDCGEGAQIQMKRNNIRFGKINNIFISHLHGDHVFGLFGLISTFGLLERTADLHIYANPKLEKILDNILKFFFEQPLSFKIIFHPIGSKKQELIYEDEKVTVETIPLKHRIPTCGFLFREKAPLLNIRKDMIEYHNIPVKEIYNIKCGKDFNKPDGTSIPNKKLTLPPYKPRSMAYCCDTRYSEGIVKYIKNVDLLYHEATYANNMAKEAREKYHSSAGEAATAAKKANAGKLIIGHFSPRYKSILPLVEDARKIFPNTFAAQEGEVHKVKQTKDKRNQ